MLFWTGICLAQAPAALAGDDLEAILAKLEQPVTMSFGTETPLEEVLKYIKAMTQGPNDNGMPIYVDPVVPGAVPFPATATP